MSATSKFTADILNVANEKAQSIISGAETETQKALDDAKASLSREADDVVRNAQTEAEGVRRRHMSEARHRIKLKEQQEKSKILQEVFEQARKRVMDMVEDEGKYLPYLVGLVESGIRHLDIEDITIHLNQEDLKRINKPKLESEVNKKLGKPVKIAWAKEPLNTSGGVIVASSDGKTRIVSTIEQTFEALESKMLIQAGKVLFGN
jgi:vacuolar-type H+-ATPase subunit E/Vma4